MVHLHVTCDLVLHWKRGEFWHVRESAIAGALESVKGPAMVPLWCVPAADNEFVTRRRAATSSRSLSQLHPDHTGPGRTGTGPA